MDVGGQLVRVDAPHRTGDAPLAPEAPIVLDLDGILDGFADLPGRLSR